MQRPQTRWMAETGGQRGPAYARRFRELAATGADLHGEARLLDALLAVHRGSDGPARVLDAGCGTGRVSLELARRGHRVVGLDVDPSMVAEARTAAAEAGLDVPFAVGDLLDVATQVAHAGPFDLVAMAGNVLVYLAPGTEADVVAALAAQLAPGGLLVAGFATDRHVSAGDHDSWCAAAGLVAVARHGTWDGDDHHDDGAYVVTVHRR